MAVRKKSKVSCVKSEQQHIRVKKHPESWRKSTKVDKMILGLHGSLAEKHKNCSSQLSETWIAAHPMWSCSRNKCRTCTKTIDVFYRTPEISRILIISVVRLPAASLQFSQFSQFVARAPIFENFPRRAISVSPLSDTSSGYFEAVASDSESASGGAKVPSQRGLIDFERFFFVSGKQVFSRDEAARGRGPKKVAPAQLLHHLSWSLPFLTRATL